MALDPSPVTCFRLRGEVADSPGSFVLEAGEHLVGSDPLADVVLPARGVSRRHASLRSGAGGIEVRDLGSKNGTQVNGRAVARGESLLALVGDEIRFGSTSLKVEPAARDDARLGLLVDPPSSVLGEGPRGETTRMGLTGAASTGVRSLHLLDALLDHLEAEGGPDLEGGLHAVADHFGARGASLVEWSRGGELVVRAAAGEVAAMPAPSPPDPQARSGRRWFQVRTEDGAVTGAGTASAQGACGLLIWPLGSAPPPGGDSEALAICLRLLAARLPEPLTTPATQATPATGPFPLPEGIVRGRSEAMAALYRQMAMLRQGDVPVLILGETGVGKEHLAQAMHEASPRSSGPFVAVNCAAIPSELLEAEMFGIGKGVATGVQPRRGKFSEAAGGTLFLDEVGDMPAALQAKLLRALQEKEIHPLGRGAEKVDVRVIAATNTNLRSRIDAGAFREDLYFRLAGFVLRVPPLRERAGDLPRLVGHFLRRHCREARKTVRGVSVEALRRLELYPWPGNVRELEHEVRRLVFLCPPHRTIDSEMLSPHVLEPETTSEALDQAAAAFEAPAAPAQSELVASQPEAAAAPQAELGELGLGEQLDALETRLLRQALRRTAGNQSRAARLLKISRNSLARRLEKQGIDAAEFQV